jgi:hypothetical protein
MRGKFLIIALEMKNREAGSNLSYSRFRSGFGFFLVRTVFKESVKAFVESCSRGRWGWRASL